jgi:hypothetical protein
MTAADEPPVVASAGVKAGAERESREDFEVELAFSLVCPGVRQPVAVSVSFADANGEQTERLARPCNGEWASNATVPPSPLTEWSVTALSGFAPILSGEAGMPPYVLFSPPPDARGPHPFLYEVTGASGVIAQAPITAMSTPEQRITEGSTDYEQGCADSGEVKRAPSGAGYCVVAATTPYYAGRPAAPAAPPPAPRTVLFCANSHESGRVSRVEPTRCNTLGPHQSLAQGSNLANLRWSG